MSDIRRRALLRKLASLTRDWQIAITHAEDGPAFDKLERHLTAAGKIESILALADGSARAFTVATQIANIADGK